MRYGGGMSQAALPTNVASEIVEALLRRINEPPPPAQRPPPPVGDAPERVPCIDPKSGYRFTALIQRGVVVSIDEEVPPPDLLFEATATKSGVATYLRDLNITTDLTVAARQWFYANIRRPVYELCGSELQWHYRLDRQDLVARVAKESTDAIALAQAKAQAAVHPDLEAVKTARK